MENMKIRIAAEKDAEQLLEIYTPYVERTAVTFEYDVPSVTEFRQRIAHVLERYPWIVAERDGEIAGYAYASAFKERAAYGWAVETTIYVREECRRAGVGRELYLTLERILAEQNILNANACIAYQEREDEYPTKDSVRFHERMGYRLVGQFHKCGYKCGRWYDMVWMEKQIGEHKEQPEAVKAFPEIREQAEEGCL